MGFLLKKVPTLKAISIFYDLDLVQFSMLFLWFMFDCIEFVEVGEQIYGLSLFETRETLNLDLKDASWTFLLCEYYCFSVFYLFSSLICGFSSDFSVCVELLSEMNLDLVVWDVGKFDYPLWSLVQLFG